MDWPVSALPRYQCDPSFGYSCHPSSAPDRPEVLQPLPQASAPGLAPIPGLPLPRYLVFYRQRRGGRRTTERPATDLLATDHWPRIPAYGFPATEWLPRTSRLRTGGYGAAATGHGPPATELLTTEADDGNAGFMILPRAVEQPLGVDEVREGRCRGPRNSSGCWTDVSDEAS